MSKFIATLAALVMLCLTGPAFSQQEASPVREPIRIGATMSITGKAYSVQGGYGREGYLLCQKYLNAQDGLLGRPVDSLIYDDESEERPQYVFMRS